jgi:hypothetical protein
MAVPLWWLARQVKVHLNLGALAPAFTGRSLSTQALFLPLFAFLTLSAEPSWLNLAKDNLRGEFKISLEGRRLGERLSELFPDKQPPSVGVVTAGGVKVTYHGVILDLMGLNHVGMGHSEGDRRGQKNHAAFSEPVFYLMAPEIVTPFLVSDPPQTDTLQGSFADDALKKVFHDGRFRDLYCLASVRREGQAGSWVCGYYRGDLLLRLESSGAYRVQRFEPQK